MGDSAHDGEATNAFAAARTLLNKNGLTLRDVLMEPTNDNHLPDLASMWADIVTPTYALKDEIAALAKQLAAATKARDKAERTVERLTKENEDLRQKLDAACAEADQLRADLEDAQTVREPPPMQAGTQQHQTPPVKSQAPKKASKPRNWTKVYGYAKATIATYWKEIRGITADATAGMITPRQAALMKAAALRRYRDTVGDLAYG